jgi:hypothetical protein
MKHLSKLVLSLAAILSVSCSYDNRTYSSKGYAEPVIQPVIQPVVRPVYVAPVVRPYYIRPVYVRPLDYHPCASRYSCYHY